MLAPLPEGIPNEQISRGGHTVPDRTESLLRLDDGDLRTFINEAPISMAMFDREMRYLAVSQRWIERVCGGAANVIGRSNYEVSPEVPEHWREFHRRALAGEVIREEGERLQRPDGSAMWLRWQAWPWHDADGEIGGIAIASEDVTAEIEREHALHHGTKALARLHDAGWRLRLASSLREGLDEMLSATIELLGGDMGHVHILDPDGKTLRLTTHYGFSPEVPKALHAVSAADDTPPGLALRTRLPVVIADTETDDSYAAFRSVAREADYRAVVKAPLIGRYGTPLAIITTLFRAPHSPSTEDLQRLELYRRRAADFIERFNSDEALRESNARLAAETKAAARFHELGLKMIQAQNLSGAIDELLSGTIELLGADMGIIQLLDDDGKLLRIVAQQGFTQGFLQSFSEILASRDTVGGRALREGKTVVIEDVELDPGFAPFRLIARAEGYRAIVAAPLVGRHAAPQGVMLLFYRLPQRPSDTALERLELYRLSGGDCIERFKAEDAMRESEERLRLAVTVSRMGMFDWDVRTGSYFWNDQNYRLFGYEPGEIELNSAAWAARIHPDDREAAEAATDRALRERKDYLNVYRIVRSDGTVRWLQAHGRFIYQGAQPMRMIGLVQDITEARQQVEAQRVLVAELQHRTRNLMAVVQSIADQTLEKADSLTGFQSRFNRRLEALSRVQGLLSRADKQPITLRTLLVMEFEALGLAASGDKIALFGGPEIRLRKSAVEMFALAIHELLTNAIKYGAFATETGRLSVTWRIEGMPPDQQLVLEWIERGIAPPALSPDLNRTGYGRTLIEQALPYSLSAETTFELGTDGLRCRISLPLTRQDADEALA